MGKRTTHLSESLEDYVVAIHEIAGAETVARPTEIARRLDVSNASVTHALRTLAELGLVNYAPYQVVTLTADGTRRARSVLDRKDVLTRFFRDTLGLKEEEAADNAHRMEHVITRNALDRLVKFLES
jgi:DtxR family transcriptional regulator, Mn-dependent transcriptional regulator